MPRGRPRKIDPEKALEAAMMLFWEKGYEATSLNDLTEVTGMAKPGLYANFGDKGELYGKAISLYFEQMGGPILVDIVNSRNSLEEDIRAFLEVVADSVSDKQMPGGCFVANSLVECAHMPDSLRHFSRDYDEKRREAFRQRFEIAYDKGELPSDIDFVALADFFASQSLALAVMAKAGNDRQSLQNVIDVAMMTLPKKG